MPDAEAEVCEERFADRLKVAVVGGVGGAAVTALMRSARYEMIEGHAVERELMLQRKPAVYTLWHGRLLPCSYAWRHCDLATLITQNRDGEYITRMIEGWGYEVLRGSSSRGGTAALRGIVRTLRSGTAVALTPDGPRGPRQKMKMGPILAAQLSGTPIVPTTAGARSAWYFGRWDRFLVPKPRTWIPLAMGEPIEVDRGWGERELEACAVHVEEELNRLTDRVDEAARAHRG